MLSNREKKQLTKIVEVFKSPQGQKLLLTSTQNAINTVDKLKKARYVDPEQLKRPITV